MLALLSLLWPATTKAQEAEKHDIVKPVKKVLFIGDSMTGWMAERLNAYGNTNNFEVATVVWDGSTIAKWANSPRLSAIIKQQQPDAILVSLGMNELLERNPKTRFASSIVKLKKAFGDIPVLWIGPPSWPGKPGGEKLNNYLAAEMGEGNYFLSSNLNIDRQSARNPHPSRKGICSWIDAVVKWIPENSNLHFESLNAPADSEMSRGKIFIYKRMKETL